MPIGRAGPQIRWHIRVHTSKLIIITEGQCIKLSQQAWEISADNGLHWTSSQLHPEPPWPAPVPPGCRPLVNTLSTLAHLSDARLRTGNSRARQLLPPRGDRIFLNESFILSSVCGHDDSDHLLYSDQETVNFKPASVDSTKPATLDIKKGPENSQIVAEYPSTNVGHTHLLLLLISEYSFRQARLIHLLAQNFEQKTWIAF
jgi:hypothetical protein